jgi:DNA-binding NarL/FixJ family response regulator
LDKTNDEIADDLSMSIRTVNTHKRNILQKFGANTMEFVTAFMLTYRLSYEALTGRKLN